VFACSPRELVTRLVLLAALCLAVHRISAQQSTFRSGVEVVQIDVSVVDRQGTPAGDLRPEDFQVTVDGRPRAIVSAQFIRYQTRTTPQPKLASPPGPRPQPAAAAPALPPRPRDILILIDQDGLDRRSCGSLAASRNPTRDRRCRSFALSAPLHARREYVIEPALERNLRNPAPGSPSMGPAVPATATGSARRTASPAGHVIRVITPDVEAVLTRAAEYVAAFEAELSGLVAEERYRQRSFTLQRTTIVTGSVARSPRSSTRDTTSAEGADWVPDLSRDLRSDFLLVKAPGSASWQPFRDVYEVDGKKTRDREARLHRLFIETPTSAVSRAAEITAEAARYNIGFVARNINVPTLALLVLTEDRRRGFAFWKVAETTIDGTRTWEIAYAEQRSPTLVRTVAGDMPAAGSFWIDPVQGRVVRSQLRLAPEGGTIEITVAYRPDEKAGRTWVPAEMHEVYASGKLRLECGATAETYRIDSNPAVRVSSSSSNTVRRSRTTRSWSMRPMIGGSS